MGDVVDIKTRKVLCASKPVEVQQAEFSRKGAIEAVGEIAEMLNEQGYDFNKCVIIVPGTGGTPPCAVSIIGGRTTAQMVEVVKAGYINLVKAAKLEEEPELPCEPA